MFLTTLLKRNPDFVQAAVTLHQEGKVPSNSYVLDIDTIGDNAKLLKETADRLKMSLFPMTKQIGRNPAVISKLRDCGITACVAVDMADAKGIVHAGLDVGHLGHLVQVPQKESLFASSMNPTYWTVFSTEKAKEAAEAARKTGRIQNILVRIYAQGDTFYTGHEGGFPAEEIVEVAKFIDSLEGAKFAGITTFPTLLYDESKKEIKTTSNLTTLQKAAAKLRSSGYAHIELNCPGTTSTAVLPLLAESGTTQVEPGNALTGTTPLHAVETLPERPAMLYLSEVSHFYDQQGYCFGGGMYIDPVFSDYEVHALVGSKPEEAIKRQVKCLMPSPASIDYYGRLQAGEDRIKTGDSVIFGFRAQAFVTRAYVTAIAGLKSKTPYVEGIYDVYGKKVGWPG